MLAPLHNSPSSQNQNLTGTFFRRARAMEMRCFPIYRGARCIPPVYTNGMMAQFLFGVNTFGQPHHRAKMRLDVPQRGRLLPLGGRPDTIVRHHDLIAVKNASWQVERTQMLVTAPVTITVCTPSSRSTRSRSV